MKEVLVLGSGGREHALAWKISQSPNVSKVYCHPGNAGMRRQGIPNLGDAPLEPVEVLLDECRNRDIQLVVIGPEVWLEKAYADSFRKAGFRVVGPNQKAAQLETSKVFAKEFMREAHIPTAPFIVVSTEKELLAYPFRFPTVLKFDGLAAGKGVVIAENKEDVSSFSNRIFTSKEFGSQSTTVLIEDFIEGRELSYIGLCDGETFLPLATSSDYKRLLDGNRGPNTGGMGAISPSPYENPALRSKIETQIVGPLLKELQRKDLDYRGALYIGLMIDRDNNPFVLEFNTRFGDPETQCLLLRLESDLFSPLDATATGNLKQLKPLQWAPVHSSYIVAAAPGYPEKPITGTPISGIDPMPPRHQIFYSGVQEKKDQLVTAGGRVFGVGACGDTQRAASLEAYEALKSLTFPLIHYRKDIGL